METDRDLDLECIKAKIVDQYPPKDWKDDVQEDFGVLIDGQKFKMRFTNTASFGTQFAGTDWRGRFVVVEATPSDRDGKLCGLKFKISKGFKFISCSYKARMIDAGAAPEPDRKPETQTAGEVASGMQGEPRQEMPIEPREQHREPEQYREEPPAQPPAARPAPSNEITQSKKVANQITNVYRLAMHKVLAPGGLLQEINDRYGAAIPPAEVSSMIAHLSIEFHKKNIHSMMPEKENILDIVLPKKQQ
jgi:hypothetical protein